MPYGPGAIPSGTEKVPAHGQAIYRSAFNAAHSGGSSEESAHAIAWAAVKKKYKKKGGRWISKDGAAALGAFDYNEEHYPAGTEGSKGGQFAPKQSGGNGETKTAANGDYGLIPQDVQKYKDLKDQWDRVNNDLLDHLDDADSPQAQALVEKERDIVHQLHGLRVDPGTPASLGLPGGPRDVTIVGGGPAGMEASVMGALEGLDTAVVEAKVVTGGQSKFSSRIENFPGYPIGVKGETLAQDLLSQADRVGAEIKTGSAVTSLTYDAVTGMKEITLANGEKINSRAVIIASGVEFRYPTFEGAKGSNVTVADGKTLAAQAKDGTAVVVGGGNSAAQAALGAAKTSKHVYVICRSSASDGMSDYQVRALRTNPKITLIENDQLTKLTRDKNGNPESADTQKGQHIPATAVGAFIGSMPNPSWIPKAILDAKGFVVADKDLSTAIPGVFVAGDAREQAGQRVAAAVGDGAFALKGAHSYLLKQKDEYLKRRAGMADAKRSNRKAILRDMTDRLFDLDLENPWFAQIDRSHAAMHHHDKEFSGERRKELAKSGKAMPGGGYPIESEQDLKNAIRAFGRAKNKAATKAWIKKRARALGKTELLPENWDSAAGTMMVLKELWDATDEMRICKDCGGSGRTAGGFKCKTCDGEGYVGIPANAEQIDAMRRKPDKYKDDDDDDDEDDDDITGEGGPGYNKDAIQITDHFQIDGKVRRTKDGYLVADARIARTGIQLYDSAELGIPGAGVIRVYRPPEEVFDRTAMRSMSTMPITLDHPGEMVGAQNWKQHAVGDTGEDVARDGEYIRVPLIIKDAKAVAAFENGIRELSVGYSTELKWGKGVTPDGATYDAKQTQIRGNHLAVVPSARGGSRLRIGDDHRGASDMAKLLIDGQPIDFADELAAKHVANHISGLQAELADAKKKAAAAAEEEEEMEEKKTRAEEDAKVKDGEIVALKKQLEDAIKLNSPEARDAQVKARTELLLKANAATEGKFSFDGKSDAEIHRMVAVANLGDELVKGLDDKQLEGAFKAITAKIDTKQRSGTDRLADSLSLLALGGSSLVDAKAVKDAAHAEYVNKLSNAWRGPAFAQK